MTEHGLGAKAKGMPISCHGNKLSKIAIAETTLTVYFSLIFKNIRKMIWKKIMKKVMLKLGKDKIVEHKTMALYFSMHYVKKEKSSWGARGIHR